MALNPNIVLGVQKAQIQEPMTALADVMKMRENQTILKRQQQEQVQQAAEFARKQKEQQEQDQEDADIQQAFQSNLRADGTPDMDKIVTAVTVKHPKRGLALQTEVNQGRVAAITAQRQQMALKQDKINHAADLLARIDLKGPTAKQQYDLVRPQIAEIDPEMADHLGEFDPVKVQLAVDASKTAEEIAKERQAALDLALSGKREASASRMLASARDQQEWDDAIEYSKHIAGLSDEQIAGLGATWSPEAVLRAKLFGMSPRERIEYEDKLEDNRRLEAAAKVAAEKQRLAEEKAEADRERQRQMDEHRIHNDDARLDIERKREQRLAAGGGADGDADLVTRRQANTWRANQYAALSKAQRGTFDQFGNRLTAPMNPQEIQDEKTRIESSYREMLGQAPLEAPPAPPKPQKRIQDMSPDELSQLDAGQMRAPDFGQDITLGSGPGVPAPTSPNSAPDGGTPRTGTPLPARNAPTASRTPAPTMGHRMTSEQVSEPRTPAVTVDSVWKTKDGRRIKVRAIDPKTGKITDYDVLQ